jgi:hypothetical protein
MKSIFVIIITLFLSSSIIVTLIQILVSRPKLYPELDLDYCAPLTHNPKRLWAYWREGSSGLTNFVRQNVLLWKLITDYGGWEIRLLHDADPTSSCSINNFIPPNMLPKTFKGMYPQISSDSVRLALIRLYGGIYMDATCILLDTLENMFWNRIELPKEDPNHIILGAFDNAWFNQPGTRNGIELWMLAALPQEPLIIAWHDLFLRVMDESPLPFVHNITSGWVHPLLNGTDLTIMRQWGNYLVGVSVFKAILTQNPEFNELYNTRTKTIPVEPTSHRLFFELGGDDNEKVDNYIRAYRYPSANAVEHIVKDTPLVKLMEHARWLTNDQQSDWDNPATLINMVRMYIRDKF